MVMIRNAVLCIMFLTGIVAGQEKETGAGVECISADSVVNGFVVQNVPILPFSPVIAPELNIPDSSVVNILLTDTLLTDTLWIVENEMLPAGLYRIPSEVFRGYGVATGERVVTLHVEARSISTDAGMLDSRFQAVQRLPLP